MQHTIPQHYTEALTAFRHYLEDDGKARRTIQSYTSDVERFLTYTTNNSQKPLRELCRSDVTSFIRDIRALRLKPATVNKAVNSLSCF